MPSCCAVLRVAYVGWMTRPDHAPPALTLGAINLTCTEPSRMAAFWAAATGGSITGTHGASVYVTPAPGGIPFFLQLGTTERSTRQTFHLDLTAAPGSRESEVNRLTALGATRQWDVLDEVPWVSWTTMADPEGNLFCIAEHHAID